MRQAAPDDLSPRAARQSAPRSLVAEPLEAAAFAAFGTVIQAPGGPGRSINAGTTQRFDLLADLQLTAAGGRPMLAIFRANPRVFPFRAVELERHAHGSQLFMPLGEQRFVVLVAATGTVPSADDLRAFVSNGRQGVVLAPGTWHHALLSLGAADYAVIERAAATVDCDTCAVAAEIRLPSA